MYSMLGHKSMSGWYLNGDNGGNMVVNNCNVWVKGYWTPENPTNSYARLEAVGPTGASSPSKCYDRSFIRFDNLAFAYTFPKQWVKTIGVENLKVYFNIRNLGTWAADWEYGDPETGGLATRTYTFGLSVTL